MVRASARSRKPARVEQAIAFGDVLLIAVPYGAVPQIGQDYGAALKGKIVLDACNALPRATGARIADEVERDGIGVVSQKYLPGTRLVRAFNTLNYMIFAREANRPDPKLAIPIAGDDPEAVKIAAGLVRDAGFDPVVVGKLADAQPLPARQAGLRPGGERRRTEAEAVARRRDRARSAGCGLRRYRRRRRSARAALWSFAYFFALLAGYYVLRPLRDQMGIAGGVRNLPWLFTATFVTLLVAQPLYGVLVARLPRARFIPIVYHFFVANLALFWLLLTLDIAPVIVARVFFVWVSVFNLFAVAVFWSFMADLFTAEQGKRLFGFIGAGGTAGGLLGPVITIGLSVPLGPVNLLIVGDRVSGSWRCFASIGSSARPRAPDGAAGRQREQRRRRRLRRAARVDPLALSYRRRRLGQPVVVLRDHRLFRAGQYRRGRGAWRGAQTRIFASIDLAVGLLTPGDADFRHRAGAQALRHRCCRRRAAGRLCRRLRRAVPGADAWPS